MPITAKDMKDNGAEVTTIPHAKRQESVSAFLKEHKDSAFTQSEIAKEFGIKPQQARQIMMALHEKTLVDRKAFGEGEDARIYYRWIGGK